MDFIIWLLGIKNVKTEEFSDSVVSNNGDTDKILATVIDAVLAFTDKNPSAYIYATGSSPARTRLYKMGISKHYDEIAEYFEILGISDGDVEPFRKEGHYDGFVAIRKSI